MGERLLCKQEVVGSIPSASTRTPGVECMRMAAQRSVGRNHNTVTWAWLAARPTKRPVPLFKGLWAGSWTA